MILYNSKTDRALFEKAKDLAYRIAIDEKLELNGFLPKRSLNKTANWGLCYPDTNIIKIIIRNRTNIKDGGTWATRPLSWKNIKDTVIHEVAHLKYYCHNELFKNYKAYLDEKYAEL